MEPWLCISTRPSPLARMRRKLGFDLASAAAAFGICVMELAKIEDTTLELTKPTLSQASMLLLLAPRPQSPWELMDGPNDDRASRPEGEDY